MTEAEIRALSNEDLIEQFRIACEDVSMKSYSTRPAYDHEDILTASNTRDQLRQELSNRLSKKS